MSDMEIMEGLTPEKACEVTGGKLIAADEEARVSEAANAVTDSREAGKGSIFFAIKGEKVNANKFVPDVLRAGALLIVSEEDPGEETLKIMDESAEARKSSDGARSHDPSDADEKKANSLKTENAVNSGNAVCAPHAYLKVKDVLQAVKDIAEWYRETLPAKIIGITGSVGKTSTKEMTASVLSERFKTLKTIGNFNNELGMPLTILRIRKSDQAAVVEMGISHFGEMERMARVSKPDACIITNIGTAHIENLLSQDGILKEKTDIFTRMQDGGRVFLNGDDAHLIKVGKYDRLSQPVFYGTDKDTKVNKAVRAENIVDKGLKGTEFDIVIDHDAYAAADSAPDAAPCDHDVHEAVCSESESHDAPAFIKDYIDREKAEKNGSDILYPEFGPLCDHDIRFHAKTSVPGMHQVMNALAATCVGLSLGMSTDEISRGIGNFKTIGGRTNIINTDKYTIIDDCYNANPDSMKAGIDVLKKASGRTVAILGDMFELGENEKELHAEIGAYAALKNVDVLAAVGKLSINMAEAAGWGDDTQRINGTSDPASDEKSGKPLVFYFPDTESALAGLSDIVKDRDTILVKASHAMGFGVIVKALSE